MRATNTNEDAAILETLALMKEIPCCGRTENGCFHRHGVCFCWCDCCLCNYVVLQIERKDALLSCYLPQLGYAVIVETCESTDGIDGGEIVALIAPWKVWFPLSKTGWIHISSSKLGPQTALLPA